LYVTKDITSCDTSTKRFSAFFRNRRRLVCGTAVFFLLLTGYETSGSNVSFAQKELALKPEVQQRVRDEILQVLSKHDGKLTYDAIKDMSYLVRVVSGEGRREVKQ